VVAPVGITGPLRGRAQRGARRYPRWPLDVGLVAVHPQGRRCRMRVEVVVLRRRLPRRPVHTTRAPDLDRLGKGVSAAAPGSIHGLQLIVQNIEVACAELADRGVNVTAGLHDIGSVLYHSSPAYEVPARARIDAPAARLRAIPTATIGSSKR